MNIDPALFILEGQRKYMYRCLDALGKHIKTGATLTVQDGQFHLFAENGDGIANGVTMHDLITGLKSGEA